MSDTSLESVLSDEPVVEAVQAVDEPQETGVQDEVVTPTTDEAEPEEEREHKGLKAAAVAERRKRQEAETRAAQLEAYIQQMQTAAKPEPKAPETLARPKRDEYPDQEAYEDALLEYGDARRDNRQRVEAQQREEREQAAQIERAANEVVAKGRVAYEDFDAVVEAGLGQLLRQGTPRAGMFRQALLASDERGHDVAYYLAQNPTEAERIYQMTPPQMVRAVALIEATKLEQTQQAEPLARPRIPQTLTQARDTRTGQFKPAVYDGPTPLDQVLAPRLKR